MKNWLPEKREADFYLLLYVSNPLLKKPISGSSIVPIRTPLSRKALKCSQLVSGNNKQEWQAAKFIEYRPCPWLKLQTGSFVQYLAFSIAFDDVW